MKDYVLNDKLTYDQVAAPLVLIGLLNHFDNRYQSAADAFFKELSWKQLYFLNLITLFSKPPYMQDIADVMGCSNQNANKLAAKLLKEGYITSEKDVDDHRKQRLFLTDKATVFLHQNQTEAQKCVTDIFKVVSADELKTTIDVMRKLTDRLMELYG